MGGMLPSAVWLNNREIKDLSGAIAVPKGATPLLLRYEATGRGHFILQSGEDKPAPQMPLAMKWYQKPGVLQYDPMPELEKPVGWYKFTSPPGLKSMTIFAHGSIQAWVNHKLMTIDRKTRRADGAWKYVATVKESISEPARITLRIEQDHGFYGGAAIPDPIAFNCAPGLIPLGDWCNQGLECYSGGAWYRRSVTLSPEQAKQRIMLNPGNLTSSAEIHVNGKLAATKLAPPWSIDISKYVKTGKNKIEILVYNTLANHYVTIPTRYRGDTASGLFGPVNIEITSKPK
ncbi:MAG: hypothetical protein NT018_06310 [Armatimonadetes bacterium]|nr:hypothetical protein [Armatimonadota bacterium]